EPDAGWLGNVVTVEPIVVTLSRGERHTFSAQVEPPLGASGEQLTNKLVAWSVKEGSIGGFVQASSELSDGGSPLGEYTAGQTTGTFTMRARSVFDPAALGEAIVVVKRVGIRIDPPAVTLKQGDTHHFHATVSGTTNTNVVWGIV